MSSQRNQKPRPALIFRLIRQPLRLALAVGFCYLVVGFINIEIWLVNENPYINGADLLACILAVWAVRVLVRILPDSTKDRW